MFDLENKFFSIPLSLSKEKGYKDFYFVQMERQCIHLSRYATDKTRCFPFFPIYVLDSTCLAARLVSFFLSNRVLHIVLAILFGGFSNRGLTLCMRACAHSYIGKNCHLGSKLTHQYI